MDRFWIGVQAALLFISMALFIGEPAAGAAQPHNNPFFQAFAQGPGQCGPTSLYMVFNHLGAHRRFMECDLREHPEEKGEYGYKITGETAICRWVNGGRRIGGTSWSMMRRAVDSLHLPGAYSPFFLSELVDKGTAYPGRAAEAERAKRLEALKNAFLDRNLAVIIHMKRRWSQPGHYLVLTGYDPHTGMVYYADPNGGRKGSVDKESFVRDRWYRCPQNTADYYRARWDGTWMGFFIRPDSLLPREGGTLSHTP